MLPLASSATLSGRLNCPLPDPLLPTDAENAGGETASELPAGVLVAITLPVASLYSVVVVRFSPVGSFVTDVGLRSFHPSPFCPA